MQPLQSVLTNAAEKIGWPMPVDYLAVSAEDRKAFEDAFSNLLKLQTMLVFVCCWLSLRLMNNAAYQG
jgi:hypothetical protein